MKSTILALLASYLVYPALADDDPVLPKTATPTLQVIRKIDQDAGMITVALMLPVLAEDKAKGKDGPSKFKLEASEATIDVADYKAQTVAGKKLETQELWRRLKVGQVVVVSLDHRGLDPAYRKALARDVVIFVPPAIGFSAEAKPDPAKADALNTDTKDLQGVWVVVGAAGRQSGVGIGRREGADYGEGFGKLTFAGDKWTFKLRLTAKAWRELPRMKAPGRSSSILPLTRSVSSSGQGVRHVARPCSP
jgi:hypothetical protein